MSYKEDWSATTIFHIWNLKGLITNEGLHMLIPWTLSIPPDEEKAPKRATEFYVRKPTILTPRRPNSVRVDNGEDEREVVTVRECGKGKSQNQDEMKLLQRKLHMWIESRTSISDKLDSFEFIPASQNAPEPKRICASNELKLSIPNLVDQGHFETMIYCRRHKMSSVVSC